LLGASAAETDADLAAVVAAWPALPAAVKGAIARLATVSAAR